MNIFAFRGFLHWINIFSSHRCILHYAETGGHGGEEMDDSMRRLIRQRIEKLGQFFENQGLSDCAHICSQYLGMFDNERLVQSGAKAYLDGLIAAIQREFQKISMLRVDSSLARFIGNENLLGSDVPLAFPSTVFDLKEAANCLAADCNTAAVFHLMRVSEYGLRALARDRQITLPKNKALEMGTWEDVIKELEDSETAIHNHPRTPARDKQFQFMHGFMMSLRAFKNAVRNPVMHTRESFDHLQATSIRNHVQEFMERLQEYLDESTEPSPKIWTEDWIALRQTELTQRRTRI